MDSTWNLDAHGFAKRLCAFAIQPDIATSSKGARIGYNILLVVKVANEGERLEDFMASLMGMQGKKKEKDAVFAFEGSYPRGISYSMKDPGIYSDRGGAHMHFIGIEMPSPAFPGLFLEEELIDNRKTGAYRMGKFRSRFPGRIFYYFLLDTCEDIHERSWAVFRDLITKQMTLDH
jgi:hypothetical protein